MNRPCGAGVLNRYGYVGCGTKKIENSCSFKGGRGTATISFCPDRQVVSILVGHGNSDAVNVKSEAARLMAALLRNGLVVGGDDDGDDDDEAAAAAARSGRARLADNVASEGGLAVVAATLATSPHAAMVGEAAAALAVYAAAAPAAADVRAHLHTDLVINAARAALERGGEEGESAFPPAVRANALALVSQLARRAEAGGGGGGGGGEDFLKMLSDLEFDVALKKTLEEERLPESSEGEARQLLDKMGKRFKD